MKTNTQKTGTRFFSLALLFSSLISFNLVADNAQKAAPCKKAKDVKTLVKKDLKTGSGKEAKAGSSVTVHYTGCLTNGTKFDSSWDRGEPFNFKLGEKQVITGWDKGVEGMKVGGKRKLIIPPDMAYGDQGAGGTIPPKATLVFEIELIDVIPN